MTYDPFKTKLRLDLCCIAMAEHEALDITEMNSCEKGRHYAATFFQPLRNIKISTFRQTR